MKVYTRGGDGGETSLFGGRRVAKDHERIESCGAVDELNAVLGLVRAALDDVQLDGWLAAIQSCLFDLGALLATPEPSGERSSAKLPTVLDEAQVEELERHIDLLDQELEPLRQFVLPGGAVAAAQLHHARTVCRRAERRVVTLAATAPVSPVLLGYLNRLSDLLFTMARAVNARAGVAEPIWRSRAV